MLNKQRLRNLPTPTPRRSLRQLTLDTPSKLPSYPSYPSHLFFPLYLSCPVKVRFLLLVVAAAVILWSLPVVSVYMLSWIIYSMHRYHRELTFLSDISPFFYLLTLSLGVRCMAVLVVGYAANLDVVFFSFILPRLLLFCVLRCLAIRWDHWGVTLILM